MTDHTSEERLNAYLTGLHPDLPALDRIAHMSDVELRMLTRAVHR